MMPKASGHLYNAPLQYTLYILVIYTLHMCSEVVCLLSLWMLQRKVPEAMTASCVSSALLYNTCIYVGSQCARYRQPCDRPTSCRRRASSTTAATIEVAYLRYTRGVGKRQYVYMYIRTCSSYIHALPAYRHREHRLVEHFAFRWDSAGLLLYAAREPRAQVEHTHRGAGTLALSRYLSSPVYRPIPRVR